MSEQPKYPFDLQALLEALGSGWKGSLTSADGWADSYMLEFQGMQFIFHVNDRKTPVEIHQTYLRMSKTSEIIEPYRNGVKVRPASIKVRFDTKRGVLHVASQIKSRLLPDAQEYMTHALAYQRDRLEHEARVSYRLGLIAEAAGVAVQERRYERLVYLSTSGGDHLAWGEFHAIGRSEEERPVSVKLYNLTVEEAVAIAKIVSRKKK